MGSWRAQAQGIPTDGPPVGVIPVAARLPFLLAESQHVIGHAKFHHGIRQSSGFMAAGGNGQHIHIGVAVPVPSGQEPNSQRLLLGWFAKAFAASRRRSRSRCSRLR